MKKKSIALLLVLFMAISTLTACGKKPSEPVNAVTTADKQELNITLTEPRSFDPAITLSNNTLMNVAFEGLVALDENDNVIPAAAEKWDISDDGLVYTFHLRDGLKWSDGQPITAQQFVYTMQRACTAENASEGNYLILPYVKNAQAVFDKKLPLEQLGVKAIDEKTLEIALEFPASYFLQIVWYPLFYPCREDVVNKDPEAWSMKPETCISNGPFVMKAFEFGQKAVFEKNPNYWDAANVKLEKITTYFFAENNTAYAAYEKGDVDACEGVPGGDIIKMYTEKDPQLVITPGLQLNYIPINHANKPLDDLNVRKAIAYAIDREAFMGSQTAQITSRPAFGMVPYGMKLAGKEIRELGGDYFYTKTANIEKAKECLAAAGYPEGKGLRTLEMVAQSDSNSMKNAQIYQEMLKKVGINIEIRPVEAKVYFQQMLDGNYDLVTAGWAGDYLHPMTMVEYKASISSQSIERWHNEAFNNAILNGQRAIDPEEQLKYILEAEKIIMEEVGIIPISFPNNTMLIQPYVKGMYRSNLSYIDMKNAYIDGREAAKAK